MLIFFFYSLSYFTFASHTTSFPNCISQYNVLLFSPLFFSPINCENSLLCPSNGRNETFIGTCIQFSSGYLYKTDSLILSLVGLFVHWFARRKNNDYPGLLHFNFSLSIHLNYEFMHIQPMVSTNNNIGWLDFESHSHTHIRLIRCINCSSGQQTRHIKNYTYYGVRTDYYS